MLEKMASEIIHVSIDVQRFLVNKRQKNAVPQLLTVSRLHRKKGLIHMLQELAIFYEKGIDFKYIIAGEGC